MDAEKINIKSTEEILIESGNNLDDKQLKNLLDKDDTKSWQLVIEYIKKKPNERLSQALLAINFDYMKPENYERYIQNKEMVEKLLEEKDGVIDENKREMARLLLKSIPRLKKE
ncbi:MAG: hypothetical protein Q8P07_03290 [bacterium]|nr:hypothetical protein [bacterium]